MLKTELSDKVHPLSDLDDTTAFLILKRYLIDDDFYARKQEIDLARKGKQFEYLDLFYILIPITEKMYVTLSGEDKKNAKYHFKDKWKHICVSSMARSYKMNDKFLDQLDKDSAKEVFVSRELIELAFKKILPEHHATLKYSIFHSLTLEKGLKKYENQIKSFGYMTKKNRLNRAIEALAKAIRRIEYEYSRKK